MKKYVAKVVSYALAPELRPFEIRAARVLVAAVLGWLGVKYGSPV